MKTAKRLSVTTIGTKRLLSDKPVITDKELSNIDRVGIILKLYPNAKFICVQRHPLDVCASIMQQDFSLAYFSGLQPQDCAGV